MTRVIKCLPAAAISLIAVTVILPFRIFDATLYWSEEEWDAEFRNNYGTTLTEYFVLGEEGFMANWLDSQEDKDTKCIFHEHCVHIRLVTIAECDKGAVVDFNVIDANEKVISRNKSDVIWLRPGGYLVVELGSLDLDQHTFVAPTDAYCSENLPSA